MRAAGATLATAPEPGFADPVLGAQAAFRALLEAFAHPGRIVVTGTELTPPAPLFPATAAVALTLFDYETPVWLDPVSAHPAVTGFLRFHCGCPLVESPAAARFAIVADPVRMPAFDAFDAGSDESPERAATLIVQAKGLTNARGRRLRGPGIETASLLGADGVPPGFWQARSAQQALFPRGLDILFADGARIVGLPRTTMVEV